MNEMIRCMLDATRDEEGAIGQQENYPQMNISLLYLSSPSSQHPLFQS